VHPLPRRVIARGIAQEPSLELHPPVFKALRLSNDSTINAVTGSPLPTVSLSSTDSVKTLFRHLTNLFPSDAHLPHRFWLIEGKDLEGSEYPPRRLLAHGGYLVYETDKSIEDSAMGSGETFVVEFEQDSRWIVDSSQVIREGNSSSLTDIPPPLFTPENDFFARFTKTPSSSTSKGSTIVDNIFSKLATSGFTGSTSFGSSSLRGKAQEPGTLGLSNM
jgi:ubiquitin carboxyl-terminal hydrolase 4/11/15